MSTDLLAPLTAAELNQLGDRLYRAFNRLCDAAEADLFESDAYRAGDPRGFALFNRSRMLMAAMDEIHELHTETVFGPRPAELTGE